MAETYSKRLEVNELTPQAEERHYSRIPGACVFFLLLHFLGSEDKLYGGMAYFLPKWRKLLTVIMLFN